VKDICEETVKIKSNHEKLAIEKKADHTQEGCFGFFMMMSANAGLSENKTR
jgi:hypothetical protein